MSGPQVLPPALLMEQAAELKREIAQRERVFPRWVADGKLTQAEADRRIFRMRSALATVEAAMASERLL